MRTFSKIPGASFIAMLVLASAYAQQPAEDKATTTVRKNAEQQARTGERHGTITGHLIGEGGQPLANTGVNLYQQGLATGGYGRNLSTDEDGKFHADDLPAGIYMINAHVPGYVTASDQRGPQYYRIGDDITLHMVKGGVITGTVRDAAGEPVIGVMVRAMRVRDAEGKPVRAGQTTPGRQTDDRGVYRLYGLIEGTYVVVTSGNRGFSLGVPSKYSDDAPAYFPSSTRDTAAEVLVQTGQEVSNIDITYRGEKGHVVSGTVSGALVASGNFGAGLFLANSATGAAEFSTSVNRNENTRGFAFNGVADGDYFLTANVSTGTSGGASMPRRISVRGADVTGLDIAIVPLASISGSITLERLGKEEARKCQTGRDALLEEALVSVRPDLKDEPKEGQLFRFPSFSASNEKGAISFTRLLPGRYRVAAELPSDNWYLKEVVLQAGVKAKQPNAGNLQLSEAATKGIALKAGEKLEGLQVALAEGAANLSGRVTAAKEGESLPTKLLVHLVPYEKEQTDNALRYAQAEVKSDGTFSLSNLAPGKYRLLARVADEGNETTPNPLAWEATGRAALRKEAEAANMTIELQTCQRLSDYTLRYAAQPAAAKPLVKRGFSS